MNVNTGELRRFAESLPEGAKKELLKNFTPVPDDLKDAADKELGDKESVILPQEHPLVQEMKKRVEKAKKKRRTKMAKESRRRNRR